MFMLLTRDGDEMYCFELLRYIAIPKGSLASIVISPTYQCKMEKQLLRIWKNFVYYFTPTPTPLWNQILKVYFRQFLLFVS